ncbi:MAG: hypothetical protein ACFBWO_12570 [Paracoccaceae bacterium]
MGPRPLDKPTPTRADKLARALAFALGSLVLLPSYAVFLVLLAFGWSVTMAAVIGFLPVLLVIPPLVLRLERRLRPIVARATDRAAASGADARPS